MDTIRSLLTVYTVFRAEVRMFDTMLQVSALLMVGSFIIALTTLSPWVALALAGFALAMFFRNFTSLMEKLKIVEMTAKSINEALGDPPPIFIHERKVVDWKKRKLGDSLLYTVSGLCDLVAIVIAIIRLS